jgi:TRAP-type mannitol/chloroaromatic compound transport system permease small subunit
LITRVLRKLAAAIDQINHQIGRAAAWLSLAMVLVQFTSVVLRYVFGIGSIWMQESVVYMHGVLFMMAAADTLLHDEHVRVDVFYSRATPARKALIDLMGCAFFILPVCLMLFYVSLPYVSMSWSVFEGSRETSGIHGIFLLKSVILAFAVQMSLQGVSTLVKQGLFLASISPSSDDKRPRYE